MLPILALGGYGISSNNRDDNRELRLQSAPLVVAINPPGRWSGKIVASGTVLIQINDISLQNWQERGMYRANKSVPHCWTTPLTCSENEHL
jgi:hypothetical protein